MTKLTRKLFISILTVAFAFVTLGATTFAWFTLTTTAKVQTFTGSMSTGTGIEMSLDGGVNFKNYFSTGEILKAITGAADGTIVFNLCTSLDGVSMYKHADLSVDAPTGGDGFAFSEGEIVSTSDYIKFDVWFRSPTQNARIYLLTDTSTASTGKPWKPDGTFEYGYYDDEETPQFSSNIISPSTTAAFNVYLADTLRMSFQKYTVPTMGDVLPSPDNLTATEDVVIYELDPSISERTSNSSNPKNHRLDTDIVQNIGMVPYYNGKNSAKPIKQDFMNAVSAKLPKKIYKNSDLVEASALGDPGEEHADAPVLLELTAVKTNHDGYYYGFMQVRIWAEGWDPDAFNAVLGASLSIDLAFGGAEPE